MRSSGYMAPETETETETETEATGGMRSSGYMAHRLLWSSRKSE